MELAGAAQYPKSKPWKDNEEGRRSIKEAVEIARRWGVVIGEDVEFVIDETNLIAEPNVDARYFRWRGQAAEGISWSAFFTSKGRITVLVKPHVLASDEAIVAVFGHETYELNRLRELFAASHGTMAARRLHELISEGIPGNLHDQAWEFADELVAQMRARK